MAEHPLLVFPEPIHGERAGRSGRGRRPRIPEAGRQAQRLAPQLHRLQVAMEQRRVALQNNTLGIQPEQVLVLETVGSINNFINAVRKINGLEWLGEFESDPIDPEHGFEDAKDPQKQLPGQLFLVMTDQEALRQMLSYYHMWQSNQDLSFPSGLAPLKQAFVHLHTIRYWDVEDRLRETGVLADWADRLESGEETIPFEIELWFRNNLVHRTLAESYLRNVISSLDGEVIQQCVIPEVAYHAILGELPKNHIQDLVQNPGTRADAKLLICDQIMYFRPMGQCVMLLPELMDGFGTLEEKAPLDRPLGEPIVALFDGLPLTRHQLLDDRVDIDDPDDYESAYQAHERFHGTMMASLISHGDLDERGCSVNQRIYARPIMKPRRGFGSQFNESIPQDVLPVDLIHRAVRRLYESEGGQPPAAPQVRVINISVCDMARPFNREISPMARLLDWLAWKYNVLFIVSAGNHLNAIQLDIAPTALPAMSPDELQRAVIEAIAKDTRNRRLLSPAETFNGLTVAATHQDASGVALNFLLDPFTYDGLPSVINAQGPGYRRTIKPDVLLPGGRQFLYESLGSSDPAAILEVARHISPPGQRVATPGTQGRLDSTCHTRGTSNAAALASRSTMLLYDMIEQLRQQSPGTLAPEFNTVLLKTLLVHGSDWANAWNLYQQVLKNGQNSRNFREYVGRFLGYGSANVAKVLTCTDQRVTVLGVGVLEDGDADEFTLPLPPSLSTVTDARRLTVTLAWLTPVNGTLQKYRIAHLWFSQTEGSAIAPLRLYADYRAVQRGTVRMKYWKEIMPQPFKTETLLLSR